MKKIILLISILSILTTLNAKVKKIIGTVYGRNGKWEVYIGSSNGIFIRQGKTAFANVCDTGFKLKGDYVIGPDGSSYRNKSALLNEIQRRLVRGKYYGCK